MKRLWCAAFATVLCFLPSPSFAGDPSATKSSADARRSVDGWASADPKAQLAAAFKEGKNLYDQGRHAEAMQVWDSASGYWDADPAIKKMIEYFQNKIQPKSDSLPVPAAVSEEVSAAPSQETLSMDEETAPLPDEEDMDDPYVISSIYQTGKALHEQGRYEEADREWQKLDGRVAEHSGVKILIDSLKQSRLSQPQ